MTGKKTMLLLGVILMCVAVVDAEVVLTTLYGAGADAEVGNDVQLGPNSNAGTSGRMRIRQLANTRSKISFLRFDISNVIGDMSDATLTLETTWQKNSNKNVNVYGVVDESLDFWNEMTITYNTAPGLLAATDGNYAIDTSKVVLLGTVRTPPVPSSYPARFSSNTTDLDMTAFLNADTNGLITLILIGGDDETELATKEHGVYLAPTLTLPYAELDEEEPEDPEDPEDPEEQASTLGPRQMERLDRGVVAVRTGGSQVFVSWRLLGTEWGKDIGFHIYRGSTRISSDPITGATNYVDATTINSTYSVSAVIDGVEWPASEPVSLLTQSYREIPLIRPAGGTTPDDVNYTYSPNDLSVGDLTGDGQYEIIVKWDPSNSKDNAHSGHTGNVYLDAYKLDGTFMWRIDLGVNIRAGAHYTQFMVYDLDGSGRAEIACKTAPGTIDGQGNYVLLPGDDPHADYRNSSGYILTGPEYLTVFDGLTGAELATTKFYPDRVNVSQWGDNYGNRVDRFLAGIAYIDGERPSLIMARGYYGPQSASLSARNEIAAYNWRQGKLTQQWYFKAGLRINDNINVEYVGQGNHSLAIADVTGNGRDDIVYGSATIKHDGTGLYSTGLGHGDALHVSNMDPSRPGLEVFMPHESPGSNGGVGASFRCATTGEILWYTTATGDVGRGVAFDIDPRYPGYEAWATNSNAIYSSKGELITSTRPSVNFGIWWTGDLLRELLDGTVIDKWNWTASNTTRLLSAHNYGVASNNGTKNNPGLVADLFGDWREEVIWRHSDNTRLLIFTTTIPTEHRLYTLMHDPVYRMSVAWQNVAYNQPTHPGFFLGADMAPPPMPKIRYGGDTSEGVLWEWWLGVSGTVVGDLTAHADFPHSPDGFEVLYKLETPQDWDNAYGSRLRGYLVAPETGDYTFRVAGDDTAELWLSPDARPENAQLIAEVPAWTGYREWDKYAAQESEAISLVVGRKYYIEVLHKEGTGGDHLSVAWQGPEMEEQEVIQGQYLRPWEGFMFGDLDDDGVVDGSDLVEFAEAWMMSGCDLSLRYDLTGDCLVDYADFGVIARYWLAFPVQEP